MLFDYIRSPIKREKGYYICNGESYLVNINIYNKPDSDGKYIDIIAHYDNSNSIFVTVDAKTYYFFEENKEELYEKAVPIILGPIMLPSDRTKKLFFLEDKNILTAADANYFKEPILLLENDNEYNDRYVGVAKEYVGKECCSFKIFLQRILKLDESFSFSQALDYVKSNPEMFKQSYLPGYTKDDPVISFGKPNISRKTDNKDKNTFDFVSVEILLRSDLDVKDIAAYTREHLEEFDSRVREHIDNAKSYQKYGVPVEFLTLYGCATRGRSCLEFKYELKEI